MSSDLWPWIVAALIVGAWFALGRLGRISAVEAHRLVEAGARLVDVRSPGEYQSGHLPGAINLPLSELDAGLPSLGARNAPLVLYCASGTRSAVARARLRRHGFTAVYNLGPMGRW
jgi:phage shock protein E